MRTSDSASRRRQRHGTSAGPYGQRPRWTVHPSRPAEHPGGGGAVAVHPSEGAAKQTVATTSTTSTANLPAAVPTPAIAVRVNIRPHGRVSTSVDNRIDVRQRLSELRPSKVSVASVRDDEKAPRRGSTSFGNLEEPATWVFADVKEERLVLNL